MSWISDTFAGIKRNIQLDGDVRRLQQAVEKMDALTRDHEKRLTRVETLIDVAQAVGRLPAR